MKEELLQVTENVWAIVLNLPVRPFDSPRASALGLGFVSGCVEIHGAWEGAVVLSVSEAMAKRAAAIMFDVPVRDVDEQKYFDATGELANIIGGNMKALLPDDTALSPPRTGSDLGLYSVEGSSEIASVALESDGEAIEVVVYRRLPPDAAIT